MLPNALRRVSCVAVWGCLWSSTLTAQQRDLLPQSVWQQLESRELLGAAREVLPEIPPADRVVGAQEYQLGPGDVLMVQIVAPVVQTHRVVVSATGELFIPRLGGLSVHGMSLAEARRSLQQLVQQRNPGASAELHLLVPRQVVVTIGGYVREPGMYVLPANLRVSTAIQLALRAVPRLGSSSRQLAPPSGASSLQELEASQWEASALWPLPSYCTRNIVLRFADGRTRMADLEWGRAMGEGAADPMLSEGMEILVPPPPPGGYPTVSIGGAVRRALRVAYRHGDRLSFLLRLAGGLREREAEPVALLYLPGHSVQRIELDTAGEPAWDPELLPGSVVLVPERPLAGVSRQGIVQVLGSVNRPGAYVIEPGRTRVRELIERAGGFAPGAALAQAYIQRSPALVSADPRLPGELSLYSRFLYSDLRLEDTVRYVFDMRLQRSLVACDFVALFERGELQYDVPLEDGDFIVVPRAVEGVSIWGQVRMPGIVPFEPGKTVEWYIQRAGGYGVGADRKRVRVVRGPSQTWLLPEEAGFLQPGDEIYVPRHLDVPAWAQQQAELQLYTVLVGAVSTLTFVMTTIINLLRR